MRALRYTNEGLKVLDIGGEGDTAIGKKRWVDSYNRDL